MIPDFLKEENVNDGFSSFPQQQEKVSECWCAKFLTVTCKKKITIWGAVSLARVPFCLLQVNKPIILGFKFYIDQMYISDMKRVFIQPLKDLTVEASGIIASWSLCVDSLTCSYNLLGC